MKITHIITSFLILGTIANAQEAAEPEAPAEKPKQAPRKQINKRMAEVSRQFANLPEEKRKEYLGYRNEASQLFQNKRIFETLEVIRKMQMIFKDDPQLYNLKGACMVELRNFDKAREIFRKALEITGPSASILFNLAEIEFVTENWEKAISQLQRVKDLTHPNHTQMIHLIDFKILLSHIKLSEDESLSEEKRKEHKQMVMSYADKVDRFADSPYYYYANAAKFYYLGEQAKADALLSSGRRVFSESPALVASWEDTLVEFGYIKSYLSEDEPDATTPLNP